MLSIIAVTFMALLGAAYGVVTPTGPGPNEIFREGKPCLISWTHDTTGTWTSFSVDLMSGSNLDMKVVTNAFKGMDGTKGNTTFSWPCPAVTPNSAIYFYQFNDAAGRQPSWTTRFTIASLPERLLHLRILRKHLHQTIYNGIHMKHLSDPTPMSDDSQKNGRPIPWGVGELKTKK
ncbi:hypothetical protein PSTT_16093 [Puccinia striiformis]|uniref:Yeast cell wall synthesis Kre9/Knh1-like N-terminal domain-containing protein n=1 Tax=Puccinia striiformis TaxID=27350 RepID=A0A2S4UEN0_9BASI|nr:hypothetical protein PSTT_16093 [Puccinia striiformis]